MERTAIVRNIGRATLERALPDNYAIVGTEGDAFIIKGRDAYGWTLDAYVKPRLGSFLAIVEER